MRYDEAREHQHRARQSTFGKWDDGRMYGYVYAIRRRDMGEIKIGWSTSPVQRIETIRACHARPLEFALVYATNAPLQEEAALHARFKHARLLGEWFTDCPEVQAWIDAGHPRATTEEWLRGPVRPQPAPEPERPLSPRLQCEFTSTMRRDRCLQLTRVRVKNPQTNEIRFACGSHELSAAAGWERVRT